MFDSFIKSYKIILIWEADIAISDRFQRGVDSIKS